MEDANVPNSNTEVATGGCLCGAVRYEVSGNLRGVLNCHCGMCRKLHGGFAGHTKASKKDITITQDRGLKWYRTSATIQRGFCGECGSRLFWRPDAQDSTGILAGSLDLPTGLTTLGHIFVGDKADFYEISDSLPQYDKSSDGAFEGDCL